MEHIYKSKEECIMCLWLRSTKPRNNREPELWAIYPLVPNVSAPGVFPHFTLYIVEEVISPIFVSIVY